VNRLTIAFLAVVMASFGQSPPPRYASPMRTVQPAAPPTTLHQPAPRLTGHQANQAAMARWEAQIAPKPVVTPQPQQTQALPLGAYWYAQQQYQQQQKQETAAQQQPQTTSAAESRARALDCGPIYLTCADDVTTTIAPLGTIVMNGTERQQEPKGRLYQRPSAVTSGPRRVILSCSEKAVLVSDCIVVQ
jgi:hypothetical protein